MVVMLLVGLALGAGHFGCSSGGDAGGDPLPVVDAPKATDRNKDKDKDKDNPEPPKTTEPDWGSVPDAGAKPTSDGGAGGGGGGGGDRGKSCEAVNTCATARKSTIASIPGDDTLVPLEIRGSTSEFISLRVTEESSLWYDLKVKATLVSPPGTNFDLAVYVPKSDVENDCSNIAATSKEPTGEDVAHATWSDSTFSNDSRTVVFQVIHVSGDCDPNARWVLKVQGYAD